MFQIFSGGWRGTEGQQTDITYLNVGVEFRKLLYEFKGARLAVLMCIVLHMDQEGVAFPSYDTIVKETGYGRGTVASAIADLCALKIKGRLVLMRWRERDDTGQFMGSNRYKVFPTNEEFYIQSSLFPTVEKTNGGKTELEETPDTEVTPDTKALPPAKAADGEAGASKNGYASNGETPHTAMKNAILGAFGWDAGHVADWGVIDAASKKLRKVEFPPGELPALYAYCASKFDKFGPGCLASHVAAYYKEKNTHATTQSRVEQKFEVPASRQRTGERPLKRESRIVPSM